ncbi:hypothetical protein [Stieleria mannarensis]|uniref:hypothetical protein n=1 Tax=Stieleria mannarensis TaxID=2755585 RepID=UPI001600D1A3|nr:hypothetical protein [Rhodopirellula sp. JC639]
MMDAIQIGSTGWILIAGALAFLVTVLACWVFSLQMCMAYFGEEIPSYAGCAGLKLKMIVAIGATLLVGYGFLGPLGFLAMPASIVVVLMMISDAARCDRFSAALIGLAHGTICLAATGFCALVFWLGLSTIGFEPERIASEVRSIVQQGSQLDALSVEATEHSGRRRNVSHSNPFMGSTDEEANTTTGEPEMELKTQ